ncbi:MAG: hypothetical protein ABI851_07485 [Saprospiraceae bacterium]
MNVEDLGKITRVEVPRHLFNKIQLKIEKIQQESFSNSISLQIKLAFALVLIINALVLSNSKNKIDSTISYADSIHLISNNSLYQ